MTMRTGWHRLLVALVAMLSAGLFLRHPGLGDDFTYWRIALGQEIAGLEGWSATSFHSMRWPVWGGLWLWQRLFGPGIGAYWSVPLVYLAVGAVLAFEIARRLTNAPATGWAAALAFCFHPLLDTVVYRPMPDLSEGVWAAGAVLAWQAAMRSRTALRTAGWAAMAGLLIFVAEANRFTGVLLLPVLAGLTLLFHPRRFHWFLWTVGCAAACYLIEGLVYWQFTGDLLTSLHANMGARGKKGTESVALWYLPLRFLDTLWKAGNYSPLYCGAALAGAVAVRRLEDRRGPEIVGWVVLHYLAYACALQSFDPPRPMLRDAERFLAALAIPMSVLAALGLRWLWNALDARPHPWCRWIAAWPRRAPLVTGIVVSALLAVTSARPFFDPGFMPAFRRYAAGLPDGTTIFTDKRMFAMAWLVAPRDAARFRWFYRTSILETTPELERLAGRSEQWWYIRKFVWLRPRQDIRYHGASRRAEFGSYFRQPEQEWRLMETLKVVDAPEMAFYRRRRPDDPAPLVLDGNALVAGGILPRLPAEWPGKGRRAEWTFAVPPELRGRLAAVRILASAPSDQPVMVKATFLEGVRRLATFATKPQMFPEAEQDFFTFKVPAQADRCEVVLEFARDAGRVRIEDMTIVAEQAPAAVP